MAILYLPASVSQVLVTTPLGMGAHIYWVGISVKFENSGGDHEIVKISVCYHAGMYYHTGVARSLIRNSIQAA